MYADDAKVGLTFTQLGLHPGMVGSRHSASNTICPLRLNAIPQGSTHFLPSLVGHEKAARLLLTGDVISGQQSFAWQLPFLQRPRVVHVIRSV